MNVKKVLVLIISLVIFIFFTTNFSWSKDMNTKKLVNDNTDFALKFYKYIYNEEGNIFFSPYSISTALAVTYAGAKGETASQIAGVLSFNLKKEELSARRRNIKIYSF